MQDQAVSPGPELFYRTARTDPRRISRQMPPGDFFFTICFGQYSFLASHGAASRHVSLA